MENVARPNGNAQQSAGGKTISTSKKANPAANATRSQPPRIRPRPANGGQMTTPKKALARSEVALPKPTGASPAPNRTNSARAPGAGNIRPRQNSAAASPANSQNASGKTQVTRMKVGNIEIEVVRTASQVIYRLPGNKSVNSLSPDQLKLVMGAINRMHAQRSKTAATPTASQAATPTTTRTTQGPPATPTTPKVASSATPKPAVRPKFSSPSIAPRPGNARIAPRPAGSTPVISPAPSPNPASVNASALALMGNNPQALAQRLLSLQSSQNVGGKLQGNMTPEQLLSLLSTQIQKQMGSQSSVPATSVPPLSISTNPPSQPGSGAQTPLRANHSQTAPTTPTSTTQQGKRRYIKSGKYTSQKRARAESPSQEASSRAPSPSPSTPLRLAPNTESLPMSSPSIKNTYSAINQALYNLNSPKILPHPPKHPSAVAATTASGKKVPQPVFRASQHIVPFVHSFITQPPNQLLDLHSNRLKSRFQAVLKADHETMSAQNIDEPFKSHSDMVQRLLPYHIYQYPSVMLEASPTFEHDCKESGKRLHESESSLVDRFKEMTIKADRSVLADDSSIVDDNKPDYSNATPSTYTGTDVIDHITLEMLRIEDAHRKSNDAEDQWQDIIQARYNMDISNMSLPGSNIGSGAATPRKPSDNSSKRYLML